MFHGNFRSQASLGLWQGCELDINYHATLFLGLKPRLLTKDCSPLSSSDYRKSVAYVICGPSLGCSRQQNMNILSKCIKSRNLFQMDLWAKQTKAHANARNHPFLFYDGFLLRFILSCKAMVGAWVGVLRELSCEGIFTFVRHTTFIMPSLMNIWKFTESSLKVSSKINFQLGESIRCN